MRYLIKNKTIKPIVILDEGFTKYLYPKGDRLGRDKIFVNELNSQIKNMKELKFIQITKME